MKAAIFSFCLPGLGQIYQGNYFRGCTLFSAFLLFLLFPSVRLMIPLVAIYAGWEAFKVKETFPEKGRFRTFLYTTAAIVGFVAWVMLFSPLLSPFGIQTRINHRADRLADRVRGFARENGRYPTTLSECVEHAPWLKDPWGSDYLFLQAGESFEIRSAGRDKQPFTKDDFVYRYR